MPGDVTLRLRAGSGIAQATSRLRKRAPVTKLVPRTDALFTRQVELKATAEPWILDGLADDTQVGEERPDLPLDLDRNPFVEVPW